MITDCISPEAGLYVLDNTVRLYLTHQTIVNNGRGLRPGTRVQICNAHILKMADSALKV